MVGTDISVSAYFGFCRALSCSPQIEKIIGVHDWVALLINMFDLSFLLHDPASGGNSFLVKVIFLISRIMYCTCNSTLVALHNLYLTDAKVLSRVYECNILLMSRFESNGRTKHLMYMDFFFLLHYYNYLE